jgi:hypothetical protein
LRRHDRVSAIHVGQAIGMLLEAGPELGRPLADRVHHSRLSNLKELRPGSARRSEIRILYIFDPRPNAVLLVAGGRSSTLASAAYDVRGEVAGAGRRSSRAG